jgi:hypothetical protein
VEQERGVVAEMKFKATKTRTTPIRDGDTHGDEIEKNFAYHTVVVAIMI